MRRDGKHCGHWRWPRSASVWDARRPIRFGAVGVVYASALAIFAAQVIPDLLWVPRLVRRRPRVAD